MADNILTKDRSGADIALAAKDVLGIKHPRNILTDPFGTDLTPLTDDALRASPVPVSISGSIPVTIASAIEITNDEGSAIPVSGPVTDAQLRASAVPVSATSLPLPAGAATEAGVAAVVAALGSPLQAGGSVAVSNLPATQAVSAASLPLPTGAATDANQSASNALQLEMLCEMTLLLSAILDRLPRVDANDRMVINTSDQGNVTVAVAAAQTLATVTTVGTVSALTAAADVNRINTLGTGATAKPADAIPMHLSNAGASYLYDRITVS